MLFHSGVSLMNLKQWSEAEKVLFSAARRNARGPALPPPMAIQIGICRYFEGRFPEARAILEGSSEPTEEYLRLYFLGRIAERSGADSLALARYKGCLSQRTGFYPAVYQAVRLELSQGDRPAAERTLSEFLEGPDRQERERRAVALSRAVRGLEGAPAPREFVLVQH